MVPSDENQHREIHFKVYLSQPHWYFAFSWLTLISVRTRDALAPGSTRPSPALPICSLPFNNFLDSLSHQKRSFVSLSPSLELVAILQASRHFHLIQYLHFCYPFQHRLLLWKSDPGYYLDTLHCRGLLLLLSGGNEWPLHEVCLKM